MQLLINVPTYIIIIEAKEKSNLYNKNYDIATADTRISNQL